MKRNRSKNRHYTPANYVFGNLRILRKAITIYVHDKNVKKLLIGHVDRAMSWKPLFFSEEDLSAESQQKALTNRQLPEEENRQSEKKGRTS